MKRDIILPILGGLLIGTNVYIFHKITKTEKLEPIKTVEPIVTKDGELTIKTILHDGHNLIVAQTYHGLSILHHPDCICNRIPK